MKSNTVIVLGMFLGALFIGIYSCYGSNEAIAFLTFVAALAAAISAYISKRNLDEALKPVVVWKGIIPKIEDDSENYKAHIRIINYGKGLAYIREVGSSDTDIGIHISTPITLGKDTEGQITFFLDKGSIQSIMEKGCSKMDNLLKTTEKESVEMKDLDGYELELLIDKKSFTVSRKVNFDLYYWNIKKECFCTHMELKLIIDVKHYHVFDNIEFQCFVINETVEQQNKREFPKTIKNHEKKLKTPPSMAALKLEAPSIT